MSHHRHRTLEAQQPERMKSAIRAGCTAANIHLGCSYPDCRCKHTPIIAREAIAAWMRLPPPIDEGRKG